MLALCGRMSSLSLSASKASQRTYSPNISSKTNGIMAHQKVSLISSQGRAQETSSVARLDVQCADGRRGGKLKTRKAAAKRFQVTGSGRVVVRHAGKNHFQEKKSSKRKQKISMKQLASDAHKNNITGCLPYAKIK